MDSIRIEETNTRTLIREDITTSFKTAIITISIDSNRTKEEICNKIEINSNNRQDQDKHHSNNNNKRSSHSRIRDKHHKTCHNLILNNKSQILSNNNFRKHNNLI